MTKFRKNPSGSNYLLEGEGFYISYNSHPGGGINFFMADDGRDETALCIEKENGDRLWLILNGDFRKEYEERFPKGLDACIELYQKLKQEHHSS